MKKITLIPLLAVFIINSSVAQQFRFGLTASPVFDWFVVDGDDLESDGSHLGFQYGLLFDKTIGDVERYAFSSGLLINYANGSISTTGNNPTEVIDFRVQYLEVPLTFRLRTNEVNYVTYYGQFGLTAGVNIKARADILVTPDTTGLLTVEDIDFRDNDLNTHYNLFNISLTIGAGLEYSLTENTAIMGGLFFQNGFTNVIDDNFDGTAITLKQLGLRIAVLF